MIRHPSLGITVCIQDCVVCNTALARSRFTSPGLQTITPRFDTEISYMAAYSIDVNCTMECGTQKEPTGTQTLEPVGDRTKTIDHRKHTNEIERNSGTWPDPSTF